MFQIQGEMATNAIVEFFRDDSNQSLLDELKIIFQMYPALNRDLALRSAIFGQIGTIPLEPGPKMGLMVRFIELGLSLVDWQRVIKELGLDTGLEQEGNGLDSKD